MQNAHCLHARVLVVIAAACTASLACGSSGTTPPIAAPSNASTTTSQPPSAETVVLATLPSPLADVAFPETKVPYPPDWPDELQFPEALTLVDASSGSLPETTVQGYAAKLRFAGDPNSATQAILAQLSSQGWQVDERTDLDSGSVLLMLENEGGGTGLVVIDTDPSQPQTSRVVVTLFP